MDFGLGRGKLLFMENIIVVGAGVIAETLLFHLKKRYKNQNLTLTQISAPEFYPPCSESSTATIALRNTKKGLSPLGDLLVDGFKTFESFINYFKPAGIEKADHHFITEKKDEKFIKRYGSINFFEHSYLIEWESYKTWLRSYEVCDILRLEDCALKARENLLILKNNDPISFDKVFWCTNFNPYRNLKFRPGSYLEIDFKVDQSVIYEVDGINIVFRKQDQKLLIGSTTIKEDHYLCPMNNLRQLYEQANSYLLSTKELSLKPFKDFKIKTGIRSLGNRIPFIGSMDNNQFGLFDFHKNGFLLSHIAAQNLLKMV